MYKYIIGKYADPVAAVAVGLAAFKWYEFKQPGPTLVELMQKRVSTKSQS